MKSLQKPSTTDCLALSSSPARQSILRALIEAGGYSVQAVSSTKEAVDFLEGGNEIAVIVIDLALNADQQIDATRQIKRTQPAAQVLALTSGLKVDAALRASNEGIFWMLSEPFENEELLYLVARGIINFQLMRENLSLKAALEKPYKPDELIAHSPLMQQLVKRLHKMAALDATVLLTGESGTGKTMVAQFLHKLSDRSAMPFMSVSCANFPHDLLESELFGHEKGAFSGAYTSKQGLVEVCAGGTLFLDEMGELPADLQPKLLTFLQDKQFRRVGGKISKEADVRVICATNKNLIDEVEAGRFRADLFYRVNVLSLQLPALRERTADIKNLSEQILRKIANRRGIACPWTLSNKAIAKLETYSWPGNIRELEHVLERATAFSETSLLDVAELEFKDQPPAPAGAPDLVGMKLSEIETLAIGKTLEACDGDKEKAAAMLGISLKTIYNKLKLLKV